MEKIRNKPFKAYELFDLASKKIEPEKTYPELVDYATASKYGKGGEMEMTSEEFGVSSDIMYGGNEGIYVTIYVHTAQEGRVQIGTIKTLNTSDEAMHAMAKIGSDFVIAISNYVEEHLDEFDFEGFTIFDGEKAQITTYTLENARKAASRYENARIRDNKIRKFIA